MENGYQISKNGTLMKNLKYIITILCLLNLFACGMKGPLYRKAADEPSTEAVNEVVDDVVDEVVNEAVDEPVNEPVDEPVDEPTDEAADEPVDEPVDEPRDEPADEFDVDIELIELRADSN